MFQMACSYNEINIYQAKEEITQMFKKQFFILIITGYHQIVLKYVQNVTHQHM